MKHNLTVKRAYYRNMRIALPAKEDWEPYTKLTVNIPEISLEDDQIIINDQEAKKTGITQSLLDAGFIDGEYQRAVSCHTWYPVARVKGDLLKLISGELQELSFVLTDEYPKEA